MRLFVMRSNIPDLAGYQVLLICVLLLTSQTEARELRRRQAADVIDTDGGNEGFEQPPSTRNPGNNEVNPLCTACRPGFGVVSMCSETQDTVCAPCVDGTFQMLFTVHQSCLPCNQCPDGEYERTPCMPFQDAVCKPCTHRRGAGFGNNDFLRKCEPFLPKTTPPTRSESPPSTTTTTQRTTEKVPTYKPANPVTERKHTDKPIVGEVVDEKATTPQIGAAHEEEGGGFQWPILLAALGGAVVCFVIGVIISQFIKQKGKEEEDEKEDPQVRSAMLPDNFNRQSGEYGGSKY